MRDRFVLMVKSFLSKKTKLQFLKFWIRKQSTIKTIMN